MENTAPTLLGIAVCGNCGTRIRVEKKHEPLIGKTAKCPKCKEPFVVQVQQATPVEIAAVEHEKREESPKRKKRTKDQMRADTTASLLDGFRKLHARLREIDAHQSSSEEQVRLWVVDALKLAIGYEDSAIDTECKACNDKVDIVLHQDHEVFMVIECKNIRKKLTGAVVAQAVKYAVTLSAEWALVTNGAHWVFLHVMPIQGREPVQTELFNVTLLDEDGVSDKDADSLYLLTPRAISNGETVQSLHRTICCSQENIIRAINADPVVTAIRKELSRQHKEDFEVNVPLEDDDVRESLKDLYSPEDFG